jgi:hypothetical protein
MRFLKLSELSNILKRTAVLAAAMTVVLAAVPAGASGGGGEEKKEGESAVAPMPKDQKEFYEKSAKLTTLTNRIVEHEKQFQELVRKKNEAKSTEEKQALIKQMVELTNTRNKDVDSYNKVKADLTYRYPNQGEILDRRYHTQSKRSMEELEGVAGLDELLTRTKKVVEKKFAPFMPEEQAQTKPKVAQPAAEEKPKRLRLEK